MPTVVLSPIGGAGEQFFDNSGNVLSGGKIYTYAAGTTTPLATYNSIAGNTANANPIVLNAAGYVGGEIWLAFGVAYKFIVKSSADVTIGTWDNVTGTPTALQIAETVAALALVTGMSDGERILVEDWGWYRYDASSSATVNGASVVTAAGGVGRWLLEIDGVHFNTIYNVKEYGATGIGAVDDYAACLAAYNACKAGSSTQIGGILYFPMGQYKMSQTLVIDSDSITIQGAGQQNTELNFATAAAGSDGIQVRGKNFVKIRDLEAKSAPQDGISIKGSESGYGTYSHLEITNVRTSFNGRDGLRLGRGHTSTFKDVFSTHNTNNGFRLVGYNTSLTFIGCYGDNNTDNGFYLENLSYSTLIGCAADNCARGYRLSPTAGDLLGVTFIACGAETTSLSAFYMKCGTSGNDIKGVKLINCFGYANNTGGSESSFAYLDGSAGGVIDGVAIEGCVDHTPTGTSVTATGTGVNKATMRDNVWSSTILIANGAKLIDYDTPSATLTAGGTTVLTASNRVVFFNRTTFGVITAELPSNPLIGEPYRFKDLKGTAGQVGETVTVVPSAGSGGLIDGAASYVFSSDNEWLTLVSFDGTNWSVIG